MRENPSITKRAVFALLALSLLASLGRPAGAQSGKRRKHPKPAAAVAVPEEETPKTSPSTMGPGSDFDQFEGEFGKEEGKPSKPVRDPLIYYNRSMFFVNDKLYFVVFKPLGMVYGFILPQPVRIGIEHAYDNLGFPVRFVNSGLQGKFSGAGRELGRVLINSTLGVGGLWDPASKWFHIKPSDADFGQTFGKMGLGTGFPVVLPVLGQTNLRDGVGLVPNSFVDPLYYVTNTWTYMGITAGGKFNSLSLHIGDYEKVKKDALDPYTFIRDAHLQNREKKIKE